MGNLSYDEAKGTPLDDLAAIEHTGTNPDGTTYSGKKVSNDTIGTTADAAVDSDTTGTVSGKLRGLVKIFANVWDSVNGWLKIEEQKMPRAEDNTAEVIKVEHRYTSVRITSNATTTVNSGNASYLKRIVINTAGASSNTMTVYHGDVATGTVIAVIDTTAINEFTYDRDMPDGITIVTATGTAPDATVVYADRSV